MFMGQVIMKWVLIIIIYILFVNIIRHDDENTVCDYTYIIVSFYHRINYFNLFRTFTNINNQQQIFL